MNLRVWAFAAILSGVLANVAQAEPLTREQVIADLTFFRDQWAPRDRSYADEARRRMLAFVNDQIARAQPMERWRLALTLSRAMAFSGNNHTKTRFFEEEGSFHVAPFSFWWFSEGPIVTRAHPSQRDLLGAEILSIGGSPVREALDRVAPYIPGTRDRVIYLSPVWLRRLEVLEMIGLSDGEGAEFEFRLADGTRVVRRLGSPAPAEPGQYPDPAQYADSWRQSIVPGRGPHPWPHVLDRLPALPLYVQAPGTFSTAELQNGRVLYLRSTGIFPIGEDQRSVESRSFGVLSDAVRDGSPPQHVIVDLRFNEGGNFLAITNLVTALVRMTEPNGRIYVLVGRGTNSAAIAFAALLKGNAPRRTKFVGEHPSDTAAFWAEGDDMKTPSGIVLHYADGFHDWGRGCLDLRRCFWPVVFHGTAIGDLKPDIPVEMRYADFAAGADHSLDAALADLATHQRSR